MNDKIYGLRAAGELLGVKHQRINAIMKQKNFQNVLHPILHDPGYGKPVWEFDRRELLEVKKLLNKKKKPQQ